MQHTIEIKDLQAWVTEYEATFASSTRERKALTATLYGAYKVYVNNKVVWEGNQPFAAVEAYNAITEEYHTCPFEEGEKVIWDSNSGYEIGLFMGNGNQYHTWLIDIRTGSNAKPCSHPRDQIYKYTEERIAELTKEYGYEKRFHK